MNYRESAIRYLNTGFKSIYQVKEYLKKREATEEEIADTVGFLVELGYLNDRRFASLTFKREYEKGRGKNRTARFLKEKGVGAEDIEQGYCDYMDECSNQGQEIDEKAMALKEARKIASGQQLDEKLKGKVARRLAGKGFTSQTIYATLDELQKNKDDQYESI